MRGKTIKVGFLLSRIINEDMTQRGMERKNKRWTQSQVNDK
jgi:hypothetical protein